MGSEYYRKHINSTLTLEGFQTGSGMILKFLRNNLKTDAYLLIHNGKQEIMRVGESSPAMERQVENMSDTLMFRFVTNGGRRVGRGFLIAYEGAARKAKTICLKASPD